jgi:pimeloyl-ACP methyl ester carboxylesterase
MLPPSFDTKLIYFKKIFPSLPLIDNNKLPHVIWGHGWGQSHASLLPLAISLQSFAHHWLIDFPGFGSSPAPTISDDSTEHVWGSGDYANLIEEWIKNTLPKNVAKIWVGHSFGCRVGLNLAAKNKTLLKGLFLIAAAGIPKPSSFLQKSIKSMKISLFKIIKNMLLITNNHSCLNHLKTKVGSVDYKNADPEMRKILVKIVNEDLSEQARKINCPTELAYGSQDTETPVVIGERLQKIIKNATLHIIPAKDHYTIVANDMHQITYLIKKFIMQFKNL